MLSARSTIYILKLNSSSDPENPSMCFYTKGLSASQIFLDKARGWEIIKCSMKNGKSVQLVLNSRFIAFQRLWRAYSGFRKRVINLRFLRKREETGISSREWSPPNRLHLYKDTIIVLRPRAPNQQSHKRLPSFSENSQGL
jgi:hypothetical protein